MARKKIIGWIAIWTILILMLATAVVFLLASSVPPDYRDHRYRLTKKQRIFYSEEFGTQAMNLVGRLGDDKSFTHSIKQKDLNCYFASLDEIGFLGAGAGNDRDRSGELLNLMDQTGLADPVAIMSDNILTIMVRTTNSKKVISLDIAFDCSDPDHLLPLLEGVRIGLMPVPKTLVSGGLEAVKKVLAKNVEKMGGSAIQLDFNLIVTTLILALADETQPISTQIPKRPMRIRRIDIQEGQLDIHFDYHPIPKD